MDEAKKLVNDGKVTAEVARQLELINESEKRAIAEIEEWRRKREREQMEFLASVPTVLSD